MNKFVIVLPEKVLEFDRFFWHSSQDNIHRLVNRLVGFQLAEDGIYPVYQPLISVETRSGQLYVEFHLSRWKSYILLFDRFGVHTKEFDIRKEYDE